MFARTLRGFLLIFLHGTCSEHLLSGSCCCKSNLVDKNGDLRNSNVTPIFIMKIILFFIF